MPASIKPEATQPPSQLPGTSNKALGAASQGRVEPIFLQIELGRKAVAGSNNDKWLVHKEQPIEPGKSVVERVQPGYNYRVVQQTKKGERSNARLAGDEPWGVQKGNDLKLFFEDDFDITFVGFFEDCKGEEACQVQVHVKESDDDEGADFWLSGDTRFTRDGLEDGSFYVHFEDGAVPVAAKAGEGAGALVLAPAAFGGGTIAAIAAGAAALAGGGGGGGGGSTVTPPIVFNHAPTGTSSTLTVAKNGSKTFNSADFGFSDSPQDSPANAFSEVIITSLPAAGTLTFQGAQVIAGQSISVNSLASLVYTPAAGASGTAYASIGFKVKDNGGTVNGGVDTSLLASTLTINVVAGINTAPTGKDTTITLLEDGSKTFAASDFGFSDANADSLSAVRITTLPKQGSLTLAGKSVVVDQWVAAADLTQLVYTPVANANGTSYASLGFKLKDTGGTDGGGVDTSISANTLTFNVTSVNDAPTGISSTFSLVKNGSKTFAASDFGFADSSADVPANSFSEVIITSLPTAGSLKFQGVAVTAGQSIAVANLASLVYAPATDGTGNAYATLGFKVKDNGGTANGGLDTSVTANVLTFNVNANTVAPSGTNGSSTLSDTTTSKTFASADFGFSDTHDSPANEFSSIIITSLPSQGSLLLSGVAVTKDQTIAVADLGKLVYSLSTTPVVMPSNTPYASLGFKVVDDGTVGNNVSETANTFDIYYSHALALLAQDTGVGPQDGVTNNNTLLLKGLSPLLDTYLSFDSGTSFSLWTGGSEIHLEELTYPANSIVVKQLSGQTMVSSFALDKTLVIDQTPPELRVDTVSLDNVINRTEKLSPVTISGGVLSSDVPVDQLVTVMFNGITKTDLLHLDSAKKNLIWSVSFDAADLPVKDGHYTADVSVQDQAGNVGPSISQDIVVDTQALTPSLNVNWGSALIKSDLGSTLNLGGVANGDVVSVTTRWESAGQTTFSHTATGATGGVNGTWSDSYALSNLPAGKWLLSVQGADAAGNTSAVGRYDVWVFDVQTTGTSAADNLTGTSGADLIKGGAGNDTLRGGQGNDTLWGNGVSTPLSTEANVLVWGSGDAGANGAVDIVKDFRAWNGSQGDKLNVHDLLTGFSSGSNIAQWVSALTGQTSPDGVANSTKLTIDVDGPGSGTVTQTIWLEASTLNTTLISNLVAQGVLVV